MRGVKMSISVSRCRENPDSAAIFAPKFAEAKRALGGVDPCPEKGGRGGLGVNPDHPQHRLRMRKGGNTKGGSEVKSFPLLLAPPPPLHLPTYFIGRKPSGGCQSVVAGKFKLPELQNSLICQLQRLPLLSQRAHWVKSKVAL